MDYHGLGKNLVLNFMAKRKVTVWFSVSKTIDVDTATSDDQAHTLAEKSGKSELLRRLPDWFVDFDQSEAEVVVGSK